MADAYLDDGIGTPFGRYGGGLAGVRPDDLAGHVVRALLARHPDLDVERIDEVIFGDANQAGEDNRNVARMAVLLAGLPDEHPRHDRQPPVRLGARRRDAGQPDHRDRRASGLLVGVAESMSRAPGVLLKPEKGFAMGDQTLHSTTLGWRMVNPQMPEQWTISLGASAEKLAGIHGISREEQDAFALRSYQLTAKAWDDGFYADWVIPVPDTELERDENVALRDRHPARCEVRVGLAPERLGVVERRPGLRAARGGADEDGHQSRRILRGEPRT